MKSPDQTQEAPRNPDPIPQRQTPGRAAGVVLAVIAAAAAAGCGGGGDPAERAAKRWEAAATRNAEHAAAVERTRARLLTDAEATGEGVEQAAAYLKESRARAAETRAEAQRAQAAVGIFRADRHLQEAKDKEASTDKWKLALWRKYKDARHAAVRTGRARGESISGAEAARLPHVRKERERAEIAKAEWREAREARYDAEVAQGEAQLALIKALDGATTREGRAFRRAWRKTSREWEARVRHHAKLSTGDVPAQDPAADPEPATPAEVE